MLAVLSGSEAMAVRTMEEVVVAGQGADGEKTRRAGDVRWWWRCGGREGRCGKGCYERKMSTDTEKSCCHCLVASMCDSTASLNNRGLASLLL